MPSAALTLVALGRHQGDDVADLHAEAVGEPIAENDAAVDDGLVVWKRRSPRMIFSGRVVTAIEPVSASNPRMLTASA